jgi:hypothetical protein
MHERRVGLGALQSSRTILLISCEAALGLGKGVESRSVTRADGFCFLSESAAAEPKFPAPMIRYDDDDTPLDMAGGAVKKDRGEVSIFSMMADMMAA